ncbi:hypothetical protein C8J57DRAFT_1055943 [Mycena rebaudengoi]|nr:hypothetical protein C8J57DRAFT_1055943 [Mycena rebaudengoi]
MSPAVRTDCLSCRIMGTGTFTGLGIYALWMSREAAPGSRGSKKIVAVLGAGTGFLVLFFDVVLIPLFFKH